MTRSFTFDTTHALGTSDAPSVPAVKAHIPTGNLDIKLKKGDCEELVVFMHTSPLLDHARRQLDKLLASCRCRRLVLAACNYEFTVEDLQFLFDAAFRACGDVTVVGPFRLNSWDAVPVPVPNGVARVAVVDYKPSVRCNKLVVFGDLRTLRNLTVRADFEVHVHGQVSPTAQLNVRAESLNVNGLLVPTEASPNARNRHHAGVQAIQTGPSVQTIQTPPKPAHTLFMPVPVRPSLFV